nr:uncharacterized protein LOC123765758 [Procambarus clarkii]
MAEAVGVTTGDGGRGVTTGDGGRGVGAATPLVLHSSLQQASFTEYLGSGFKIRVSDKTGVGSVILPRCGVAALVVQMPRLPNTASGDLQGDSGAGHVDTASETLDQLIDRVRSFMRGHRVTVVVVVGAVFGEEEVGGVLGQLQLRLLPRPPLILPAHGHAQAAAHIQVLAKATLEERRQVVEARMGRMVEAAITREHTHVMGQVIGLNFHQMSRLVERFGSLGGVVKASAQEIQRGADLDPKTAAAILAFLTRDTVTV